MGQFRYAYNQLVYYGEDVGTSIDRVARFGYDAIELAGEPDDLDAAKIKKRIADAGIAVSSICSIYTAERDLAHPDADVRAGALDYVKRVADFAAEIGAPTIIAAPTACMKLKPLADRDDERRWAIEGLRAAGEYAAERDVNLTLECWNRYETYWLNRLDQGLELWQEVGLDRGGVMGDTFHMNIEEDDIAAAIRRTGPTLNHVHLADSNRAAPGEGHIDFVPVLEALAEVGYGGYLSFELLPPSADPFGVMQAGGHQDFLDRYTEQAIVKIREAEAQLAGATS
ncbi:MAG TPA: sugar phosphate isomerase/epimerase family protein [Capillimicrobium sp.]|nr:sugar phosphate isomerase/epimerase family protein [Capillimicrobium sp.]